MDRLSDIDEFEESFKYLSVMDKTKCYYTLCKASSPIDTPPESPAKVAKQPTPPASPPHHPLNDEGILNDVQSKASVQFVHREFLGSNSCTALL